MILVAGALALAAPAAIAESQLGAAPDGSEPAATGTSSPRRADVRTGFGPDQRSDT